VISNSCALHQESGAINAKSMFHTKVTCDCPVKELKRHWL